MRRLSKWVSCYLWYVGLLTGCGNTASGSDKEPIVFADANWASLRFHNEIAGTIIEAGYGYETKQRKGSTAAVWTGIEKGNIDVHMETWTQNIKKIYDKGIKNQSPR
ncbi:hypothetical protein EU245_14970 [Lentibacillus lipolyticus]|nr:hypothetical protein EU245_14970 [Lentibacillus lipolyticus]